MKRRPLIPLALCLTALCAALFSNTNLPAADRDDGMLRIICFGAHPDDAEYKSGGTAAKWAALGHHVKMVSVTNGDIGHWKEAGGALAKRRTAEAAETSKILGTTSEVLDIHDGELMPTLENRKKIVRLIRDWKADVVIAHRPWDYHPDHRYVGILVQDAAFMVTVPFFCPDVPHLETNPLFLYSSDRFQKPYPFEPTIAVDIDDVIDQKVRALEQLRSQNYEGGVGGSEEKMARIPSPDDKEARFNYMKKSWSRRNGAEAKKYRDLLIEYYGREHGEKVQHAEVFEICEYGRRPSAEEIRKLFPFYGN
ncbi:MAG: PIG-L deacetylase family protein [Verrucomicrobiales bacterium]